MVGRYNRSNTRKAAITDFDVFYCIFSKGSGGVKNYRSISLKIIGEDRKYQIFHLIGYAAYERKGH